MYLVSRILDDCFWDYEFTADELKKMATHSTQAEKRFLFSKIVEHSTDVLNDLEIFSLDDQKALLQEYKVPSFKNDYLAKRNAVLRHFILGEKSYIKELAWR